MTEAKCWLCSKNAVLCNSHVIPKFVFRWLINSGGTPYLRFGGSPNRRIQDGPKHKLYCHSCEQLLSKYETVAKSTIFDIAVKHEKLPIHYGPWLSRFAASVALRTIHSQKFRNIDEKYSLIISRSVEEADKSWKKFLKEEKSNPGKNKLYLFYPGYFDRFDAEGLPSNWNTYVRRAVEQDVIYFEI